MAAPLLEGNLRWPAATLDLTLEYLDRMEESYVLAGKAVNAALNIRDLRGLVEDPAEIRWPEERRLRSVMPSVTVDKAILGPPGRLCRLVTSGSLLPGRCLPATGDDVGVVGCPPTGGPAGVPELWRRGLPPVRVGPEFIDDELMPAGHRLAQWALDRPAEQVITALADL